MDTKSTSNAIIIYNKKILLLQRDGHIKLLPDRWALPGGHIADKENQEEALSRELKEEIGFLPDVILYIGKYKTPKARIHSIYFTKLTDGEVSKIKLGNEGQKLQFFNFEELKKMRSEMKLTPDFNVYYEEGLAKILQEEKSINPKLLGLE